MYAKNRHKEFSMETRPLDDTDLREKQMSEKSFIERNERKIIYLFIVVILLGALILISRR